MYWKCGWNFVSILNKLYDYVTVIALGLLGTWLRWVMMMNSYDCKFKYSSVPYSSYEIICI